MARAPKASAEPVGLSVTLDRAALTAALGSVIKTVATSVTIPILTHVLLRAEGERLTITGTNLDQWATTEAPADVASPGAVTLSGHALNDLARRLPADARVTIAENVEKANVSVTAGRSRSAIPTLPVGDFPDVMAAGAGPTHTIELAGTVLADLFARSSFAISSEETRYYLNGIFAQAIERDGATVLRFVATDGHRLARIDTAHAAGLDLQAPGVIIPTKAVRLFADLAKATGDTPLTLALTHATARLSSRGGNAILTKLVDGTFPDYGRVIPQHFARESATATLALAQAVERVGTLSDEKGHRVRLDFEADRIAVTLPHQMSGATSADEVEAEMTGAPLAIGFNPRFLAEVLTQCGADKVVVRLGADASQPAVITDKSGDGLYVLMPMRI